MNVWFRRSEYTSCIIPPCQEIIIDRRDTLDNLFWVHTSRRARRVEPTHTLRTATWELKCTHINEHCFWPHEMSLHEYGKNICFRLNITRRKKSRTDAKTFSSMKITFYFLRGSSTLLVQKNRFFFAFLWPRRC